MLEGCHSTYGEPQSINPPHYRRRCWDCLITVRCSTTTFRSDSNQNFCLAMQSKTSTVLAATGPWYSQCATCMAPSCMNMAGHEAGGCQGIKVWHSLSVEKLVKIPPSGHDCPGSRPMIVCNYGKGTTIPWRKRIRRHRRWTQTGWRGPLTFFDALGVCPIGPTWRGYLLLSFRGYQRFDQWLQLSYPPPKSLLHAIVERRSSLSCLSGRNNREVSRSYDYGYDYG